MVENCLQGGQGARAASACAAKVRPQAAGEAGGDRQQMAGVQGLCRERSGGTRMRRFVAAGGGAAGSDEHRALHQPLPVTLMVARKAARSTTTPPISRAIMMLLSAGVSSGAQSRGCCHQGLLRSAPGKWLRRQGKSWDWWGCLVLP